MDHHDSDDYPQHDHIIIGGKKVHVAAKTVLWEDTRLEVKVGDGARRRHPKGVIDLFVWHWTGGENDVETLFRVLDNRELGVEFAIDHVGVIWQFCDPILVDTFDAGFVNARSIGCEIVNYGFRGTGREPPGEMGKLRDTYFTTLRGKRRKFARFFPAQINAAVALANAVSAVVPTIPKCIPLSEDGTLLTETMSRREVRNWSGHLGHYHINEGKSDPGTDLFDAFAANGFVEPARQSCHAPSV